MQYDPTNELILLTGVRKDGAISYFIRAVSEDDAAAYARAYACLLETDEQNDFYGHVAHAVLFDDNLFARRCFSRSEKCERLKAELDSLKKDIIHFDNIR